MTYLRKKKIKGKEYYYIVEGQKGKDGKIKQKVIMYLGDINKIIQVFKQHKDNSKHL